MSKLRFFTSIAGASTQSFSSLVEAALSSVASSGAKRIVFLAATLNNNGWLDRYFGNGAIPKLKKGTTVKGWSVPTIFCSLSNYRSERGDLVILMGLRSDQILPLEAEDDIYGFFATPWLKGEVDKWAKIYGAICIEDGKALASNFNLDPVVKAALTDLSEDINMTTGITHPSDEHQAKTFIRALHGAGLLKEEEAMEAYLISELGWEKESADDLMKLVKTLNAGKYFQGGDKTGGHLLIKRWKASKN